MPRTVTEDVDGKKGKKERKEKREALWEVGFDHSLGEKKMRGRKRKGEKMEAETGGEDSILAETPPQERLPPRGAKGIALIAAFGVRGGGEKKEPVICDNQA